MDWGRRSASYYDILGVGSDSSLEEIRRAYRKLAMRWHPDKWARNPSSLGDAKHRFQQIQEAYSVLSDQSKRMLYDAGMYDPEEEEEEEEGFSDFVQEMVLLMAKVKREEKGVQPRGAARDVCRATQAHLEEESHTSNCC